MDRCYACDAPVYGIRDRTPEGGKVELACRRHSDPYLTRAFKRVMRISKRRHRRVSKRRRAGRRR